MSETDDTAHARANRFARKLVAILHAEVRGYSRLIGQDDTGMLQILTPYLEMMRECVPLHGGQAVGSRGDSLLATFPSTVAALQSAIAMQQELKARNATLSPERRVEFRIGLNAGEILLEGEEIHGDAINIAVRLEGVAEAGGICLSEIVYRQVKHRVAVGYADLGEQTLKNIAEPVRAYRVRLEVPSPLVGEGQGKEAIGSTRAEPLSQPDLLPLKTHPSSLVTPSALPLPDKPSIVVLPFVNLSNDPEQEYFSDGLTEDLITDLSHLSGLFVIARNTAFTYKGKAVKVQDISKEMGVRYVLEGSVRKAGNHVRITAQLIDATTSYHLWSERYDREMHDLFALQDEIRRKIVAHLAVRLTEEEQESLGNRYATTPEAYDYFLRGWRYWLQGTKETNVQARQMFEKALELDPSYAEAYAGLGQVYYWAWWTQWDPDPQNLEHAFAMAQRARTLDESSATTHLLLVSLYVLTERHEQAIAEARRVISLVPNWATGYEALGRILNFIGQPEEALKWVGQAMRLDPRSPRPQYYGPWARPIA